MNKRSILIMTTLALASGPALAYVGPGAGISMLGALWGLIIGVVMALGVILFWPIRMMLRKAKAKKEAQAETDQSTETSSQTDTEKTPTENSQSS